MDRFWSKVDKSADCWLWTASQNEDGYGKFGLRGTSVGAHRVAYELEVGPIPSGLSVLHRCDNPPCVNPGHLFLGTQPDNIADMTSKGRRRAATGDRHGSKTHPASFSRRPSGDEHGLRKHPERAARGDMNGTRRHPERLMRGSSHYLTSLTEDDVRAIRLAAAAGERLNKIAERFPVSRPGVSMIVARKTWKHVL